MNRTTKIIVGIVVVVILAYVGFGSNKKSTNAQIIKIGAPLALTGTAATDALNIKRGVELAQEDLIKQGVKVEVIYEDDGTDPKRTVTAVSKLINVDKVDFLIGPTWSFLTDAGSPVFNNAQVVSFNPANTSEFTNGGKFGFYGAAKNTLKREPIAKWLKDNKKLRVASIVDNGTWGKSNLEAFKLAVADAGAEMVFSEEIPFGQEVSVMPTVLTKLIDVKPDVILTTGFDQSLTILIKKTRELNIDLPIVFASGLLQGLIDRGVVSKNSTDKFYVTVSVLDSEFTEKFKEKYGEYPGLYADTAYDGMMLLVEAVQQKRQDQTLEDYLRNETNYKGYGAIYNFDNNGDIMDGKWVIKKLEI